MKKELFDVYIDRFGLETLKTVLGSKLGIEEARGKNKGELVEAFFEIFGRDNDGIALAMIENFGSYHQHVHLFQAEGSLPIKAFKSKIGEFKFPGFKGDEVKYASSVAKSGELRLLLYVPFSISFHATLNGNEIREHDILHTPVLLRLEDKRAVISIMTFTKGDWSKLLPKGVIDSRSHFREDEVLFRARDFVEKLLGKLSLQKLDYTQRAKEVMKMEGIDLYLATKIGKCETRLRALYDTAERKTLKGTVPQELDEVLASPIITHLDIILIDEKFGLPSGCRLTFLPSIGSMRISQHIAGGNIDELQNYLLS